jgi:hypothetical protein
LRRTFTGVSVSRDNVNGEWSYMTSDHQLHRFKGLVECRPIIDVTPSIATQAEAVSPAKQ